MKFKNHYNELGKGEGYEVNNEPSLTIPDQAMSMREMMDRFVSGQSLEGGINLEYYGEDDDLPDLTRLDRIERIEVLREAAAELKMIKDKANKKAAEVAAQQRKKEFDDAINEAIAKRAMNVPDSKDDTSIGDGKDK